MDAVDLDFARAVLEGHVGVTPVTAADAVRLGVVIPLLTLARGLDIVDDVLEATCTLSGLVLVG